MINRRTMLTGLGASALTLAAPAIARARYRGSLQDGAIISLRCLGHIQTRFKFLDGRTVQGTVGLAQGGGGGFSGAFWRVDFVESDVITLNCQGHIDGPRWLDGRTQSGSVGLVPHTGGGFTGTRWRLHSANVPNVVALECMGHLDGNRWLDGRTQNGTVGLAPQTGGGFTGTAWAVEFA